MLLEVDADPTEKDSVCADVFLVGQRRRIHRQQEHIVPLRHQGSCKRIVAYAAAAVHATGTGRDVRNAHGSEE